MNRRDFLSSASATIASSMAWNKVAALVGSSEKTFTHPDSFRRLILFGADYYPDQTSEELWEHDAAQMAANGITNVRIAEFAWALMEPQENTFDFEWLLRSISILHRHGIAVILGTPSAAPPPWLSQKYPEVLMVDEHGATLSPGTRRFTCPTNTKYRELSVRIATKMAQVVGNAPGVIGWQIDNEMTLGNSARCYCNSCRAGFQEWLKSRYGSLQNLNEKWGTVFWSNLYTDFSQIPVPLPSGAVPNPGFALDYYRYQTSANTTFIQLQAAVLRKLCPGQFLTTNNVGGLVDNINMREFYRDLDFVAYDNYPGFFALYMGSESGKSATLEAMTAAAAFGHDFMRSMKDGDPFLIMEEQSGKAGQPIFSPQPEPGQLRLWSYQAVAHGAMGINYFRWDTATSGAEEYWHGLLNHDRSPSPGFNEIRQTLRELKALGTEALQARYQSQIALCYDSDSDWAFSIQPGQPQVKYLTEVLSWYGSLMASQAGVDIVDAKQDLSRYKVVCAPSMYVLSAQQAEMIRDFVKRGGMFITGFRLGVKDEYSRIVQQPLPGLLRDVMGCELLDYEPIYGPARKVKFTSSKLESSAECRLWADILKPTTAQVLATYADGQYAGKAAVTSNHYGRGQAIYLGCRLDGEQLGKFLMAHLHAVGLDPQHDAPTGVEIATRQSSRQQWTYLLNHTPNKQMVHLHDASYRDLQGHPASAIIELLPYGVQVLTKQR